MNVRLDEKCKMNSSINQIKSNDWKTKKPNTKSFFIELSFECVFVKVFLYFRVLYHVQHLCVHLASCLGVWSVHLVNYVTHQIEQLSCPLSLFWYCTRFSFHLTYFLCLLRLMSCEFQSTLSLIESLVKHSCEFYNFLHYIRSL